MAICKTLIRRPSNMQVFDSKEKFRQFASSMPLDCKSSLVPTMGALHIGHMKLIEAAKEQSERVMVSIFCNPKQFDSQLDLQNYPKTLEEDLELLEQAHVSAVFCPSVDEMYSPSFQSYVSNQSMSNCLCGADRPGHFTGVCTVVLKLVNLSQADFLVLGQKDMQQVRVIEKMVTDLDLKTKIIEVATLRDSDGLAYSSRNARLTSSERKLALELPKALINGELALKALNYGTSTFEAENIIEGLKDSLSNIDGLILDYLELRSSCDLSLIKHTICKPAILFGAVQVGKTRLIDNRRIH